MTGAQTKQISSGTILPAIWLEGADVVGQSMPLRRSHHHPGNRFPGQFLELRHKSCVLVTATEDNSGDARRDTAAGSESVYVRITRRWMHT